MASTNRLRELRRAAPWHANVSGPDVSSSRLTRWVGGKLTEERRMFSMDIPRALGVVHTVVGYLLSRPNDRDVGACHSDLHPEEELYMLEWTCHPRAWNVEQEM